jgi:hypothetical protein
MARKRATAKAPAKKKAPAPRRIEVDVDLGSLKTTPEQEARLRAHLDSILLTWVKSDLKEKAALPIILFDHHSHPTGGGEEGGNE